MTQEELDQSIDQFKVQFGDKPSEKHFLRVLKMFSYKSFQNEIIFF